LFNRLDADIFVVNNVTDAGSRNEWSAILSGGLLCTLTYITSGGHSGTSLAFKAAVTSTRKIWCSDEFIRLHPEAHQILVTKSRMPGSKFSWIADKSTLLDLGTRRTNAGRGGEIVAFVSSAEQRSEETSDESLTPPQNTKLSSSILSDVGDTDFTFQALALFPTSTSEADNQAWKEKV
jgi:hypothetical protein